jgi:hypothetical protein
MAKTFLGTHKLLAQVCEILTTEVLEFTAFEQVPHALLSAHQIFSLLQFTML